MTCKEIYNLHACGAKESGLHDAYRDVLLDSRDEIHKNNTPLHTACYFADITAVAYYRKEVRIPTQKTMTVTLRYVSWQGATLVKTMPFLPTLRKCSFLKGREFHSQESIRPS